MLLLRDTGNADIVYQRRGGDNYIIYVYTKWDLKEKRWKCATTQQKKRQLLMLHALSIHLLLANFNLRRPTTDAVKWKFIIF